MSDYSGKYRFFDQVGRIELRDDKLVVHFPWGDRTRIYPETENLFFSKDFNVQFKFLRGEDGAVDRVIYIFKGSENEPFPKLIDRASTYVDLDAFCGDYYRPELKTAYSVVVKNNHLILEHLHNEDVLLLQLSPDRYLGNKWWCVEINATRDKDNRVTGFRLNGDDNDIQNLVFVRRSD